MMKEIVRRTKERGRKKYLWALLVMLCFCLLITICPAMPGAAVVHATGDSTSVTTWNCGTGGSDSVTATLSNGTLTISGKGAMENFTANKQPWFSHENNITSVVIEEGVTSIGKCAFYGCSKLESVTIPKSVTSIGNSAFYNCSSLTSVTIPASVNSIMYNPFHGCSSLTSIKVAEGNTKYDSRNNCNAIIITAENTLVVGCKETKIPTSVTSIGNYAFQNCSSLTSVAIPDSVKSIGTSAFRDCSGLTSVTIPNSVTSIGTYAFYGCSGLTSVTIPNSVTSIRTAAFQKCSGLTSVTIPDSVTSIGNYAFQNCSQLTSVTIPNRVTSIGFSTFSDCTKLKTVVFEGTTPPTLEPASGNKDANVFKNCGFLGDNDLATGIVVPEGCENAYKEKWETTFPQFSDNIADHSHTPCGTTCSHKGGSHTGKVEYIPFPEPSENGVITLTAGKSYYLTTSVILAGISSQVRISGTDGSDDTVNICLNGYTITGDSNAAFSIQNAANVNICDCNSSKNGNGKIINNNNSQIIYVNNSELNIYGGTIETTNSTVMGINLDKNSTLNLYGGKISTIGTAINVATNATDANINIYDGATVKSTGSYAIHTQSPSTSTINIQGGDISSTRSNAIYTESPSTIDISGGTVSTTADYSSTIYAIDSKLTISGDSKITNDALYNNSAIKYKYSNSDANTPTLIITGGTIKGGSGIYIESGTVEITGGTIESTNGGSATIDNTVNGNLKITGGKVISKYIAIANSGTVTIENTAEEGISSSGGWALFNYAGASATISGGKLKNTHSSGSAIGNEGTVNVRGTAEITSTSANGTATAINNGVNDKAAILTIEGGTITSDFYALENNTDATATISGGDFTTSIDVCIYNKGKMEITGANSIYSRSYPVDNTGELTISGGTYKSNKNGNISNSGTLKLSGSPTFTNTGIRLNRKDAMITIAEALTYNKPCRVTIYEHSNNGNTIPRTFTSGWNDYMSDKQLSDYFKSDLNYCTVTLENNEGYIRPSKVTFDLNYTGCTNGEPVSVGANCKVSFPADPTREGYVFGGWYDAATDGTKFTADSEFTTGDTTLYARWEQCTAHTLADFSTPTETQHTGVCTKCGKSVTENHEFKYSVSYQTMYENCDKDCGHRAIATLTIPNGADLTYTGSTITPATITYSGDKWVGAKPTIEYSFNINVGEAWARICHGTIEGRTTFEIEPKSLTDNMVTLGSASYPHTGSAVEPDVTVTDSAVGDGKTLTEDTDYTVSYSDNTNVGTATVTVTGNGNYTGSVSKTFSITADKGWTLAADGTLTIRTQAGMDDWADNRETYDTERSKVISVTIESGVTSIGSSAFFGCSKLTSVTIGNKVTSIGSSAFSGCSGLTSVEIPASVESIGVYAFQSCSGLTSVNIPASVETIESGTFSYCSGVTGVTIENGVKTIGNAAFYNCSKLTSVNIPASVNNIGTNPFGRCSSLTSIRVEAENTTYNSWDNCNAIIETNENKLVTGCMNTTIPSGVTSIGWSAFNGCSGLTSVTIPDSVTSMGAYAFSGCSGLASVTIPSGVTSIALSAFEGCSSLEKVTMKRETPPTLGSSAFSNCPCVAENTKGIYVPVGKGDAYKGATGWSTYKDNITEIVASGTCGINNGDNVKWTLTDDGTLIISGTGAMVNPNSSGSAPFDAYKSKIKTVVIENGVTSIGGCAFYDCSNLASINIPNSVTSIGWHAFNNCSSLTSITIPSSVTGIKTYAFNGCSGLTSVTIPDSVTNMGGNAFSGCSGLKSVTIPDSVTNMGSYAFSGCSGLTSVTIGNKVTSIDDSAFRGCSQLKSVNIPESVTRIGKHAFDGCSGLTSVTIPDSVTNMGSYAFSGCSGLTSVTIGSGMTIIGNDAFDNCSSLEKVTMKREKPPTLGINAFYNCSNALTITVPSCQYEVASNWSGYKEKITPTSDDTFHNGFSYTADGSVITQKCACKDQSGTATLSMKAEANLTYTGSAITPVEVNYSEGWKTQADNQQSITYENNTNAGTDTATASLTISGKKASLKFSIAAKPLTITAGNQSVMQGNSIDQTNYTVDGLITGDRISEITLIPSPSTTELTDNGTISISGVKIVNASGENVTGNYGITTVNGTLQVTHDTALALDRIEAVKTKTSYTVGDTLNVNDITVTEYYADGHTEEVKGFTTNVAGIDMSVAGNKTLTISYTKNGESRTANITITVKEQQVITDGDWSSDITSEGGVKIVGYFGSDTAAVEVPSEIGDKTVTAIGENAFAGHTEITSVTIPDSVKVIGEGAFSGCTGLTTIIIPEGVDTTSAGITDTVAKITYKDENGKITITSVTPGKDSNGGEKPVTLPDTIGGQKPEISEAVKEAMKNKVWNTVIASDGGVKIASYSGSGTAAVEVPSVIDGRPVTAIGENAFSGHTEITSVTIPDSVKVIGEGAFSGCTGLTTIIVPEGVDTTSAGITDTVAKITYRVDGNGKITITSVTPGKDSNGGEKPVTLPDTIGGKKPEISEAVKEEMKDKVWNTVIASDGGVKIAGYSGSGTAAVEVPSVIDGRPVTAIGENAFANHTEITSVTIPDSVTTIGKGAFSGCTGLTSITIPGSVTEIGKGAFSGCTGLTTIIIPEGVDTTSAGITDTVAKITYKNENGKIIITSVTPGKDSNGGEKPVTLPDTIGGKKPEISDAVKETMKNKVWNTVITPEGVKIVGYSGSGTAAVEVPSVIDGRPVTEIGENVFAGHTEITSVTIPDSVKVIGEGAFSGCTGLTTIIIPEGVDTTSTGITDTVAKITYKDENGKITITSVAPGSVTAVEVPSEIGGKPVTTIGEDAFSGCTGLTSVTIPDSVTVIGEDAFSGCTGLTSVTIPDSVTAIGEGAFSGCTGLTSVTIPNSVTAIGKDAFSGCTGLTTIIIPENLDTKDAGITDTVAKITYTVDGNGKITITSVTPGTDSNGGKKPVTIPDTIGGQKPEISDTVKEEMKNISHEHKGGTATCIQKAVCEICGAEYGDFAGHTLAKTEGVEPTRTADGNMAYWTCSKCGKKFSDENGVTEITDPTIPATGNESPKSGDDSNPKFWTFLMLMSMTGLVGLFVIKKKSHIALK